MLHLGLFFFMIITSIQPCVNRQNEQEAGSTFFSVEVNYLFLPLLLPALGLDLLWRL
jgi:hypothetical protein